MQPGVLPVYIEHFFFISLAEQISHDDFTKGRLRGKKNVVENCNNLYGSACSLILRLDEEASLQEGGNLGFGIRLSDGFSFYLLNSIEMHPFLKHAYLAYGHISQRKHFLFSEGF